MSSPNGATAARANAVTETASATLVGFLAIPIWALLSALTVVAGDVPPLELVAITFTVGTFAGALFVGLRREERKNLLRVGFKPVVTGIAGLFGYHFTYFLALQNAPAVEASLVNYLWPVLIVVFSAALPPRVRAGKLNLWHLAGVSIAFVGAALAIGGGTFHLGGNAFGYGMALLAALIWSTYSVVTRLFQDVRSAAVVLYCFGTAVLAWAAHLLLESLIWPQTVSQWLAIAALGIGPLGAAFFAWDYGCKRGDLRLLGTCAYFAPVLSTALLTATGLGDANSKLWLAALLITGGALLSSADNFRGMRAKPPRQKRLS